MRKQSIKAVDTCISAGLLIASILALVLIGIGVIFAVSMAGSWTPVLIFSIPLLVAAGAICYRFRRKSIRRDDEVRHELSWRREVVNAVLILTLAAIAWLLHLQIN